MPEKKTIERAREDAREGKAPSTQAGEFVREEMDHIREGKHGARSPQQAIAIGLVESTSRGRETAATQERTGLERDGNQGRARLCEGTKREPSEAVRQAIARDIGCFKEGRPGSCVPCRVIATGQERGEGAEESRNSGPVWNPAALRLLLGRHADSSVEANHLAIQHGILDDLASE